MVPKMQPRSSKCFRNGSQREPWWPSKNVFVCNWVEKAPPSTKHPYLQCFVKVQPSQKPSFFDGLGTTNDRQSLRNKVPPKSTHIAPFVQFLKVDDRTTSQTVAPQRLFWAPWGRPFSGTGPLTLLGASQEALCDPMSQNDLQNDLPESKNASQPQMVIVCIYVQAEYTQKTYLKKCERSPCL